LKEIQKVVEMAKGSGIKIFGKGDIQIVSKESIYCQKYGVDGVLIGRAAGGNPWAFIIMWLFHSEKFFCHVTTCPNF
jgi:tRNA-dihydrouridine synthase